MTKAQAVAWIKAEFSPLTFATPDATIEQQWDNAIRYFNTHSAYKYVKMYSLAAGGIIQLDKEFKNVIDVLPNLTTSWIFEDHPLWTLLGITILDNVTSDLIMLGEAYRSYKDYVGTQMRWKFERSDDPSTGGWLFIRGTPMATTALYVVGTKRLYTSDDIVSEHIINWILNYMKGLFRVIEGNTLRKSDIIGVKNDGQAMLDEGKSEIEELQKRLAEEGRWSTFCKRF